MDNSKEREYHSILQLSEGCSLDEIHTQYRHLSELYHPSNNPGEDIWCKKLQGRLNEAYEYFHWKHSGAEIDFSLPEVKTKSFATRDDIGSIRRYESWRPDVPFDSVSPFDGAADTNARQNKGFDTRPEGFSHSAFQTGLLRGIGVIAAGIFIGIVSMLCLLKYGKNIHPAAAFANSSHAVSRNRIKTKSYYHLGKNKISLNDKSKRL